MPYGQGCPGTIPGQRCPGAFLTYTSRLSLHHACHLQYPHKHTQVMEHPV
ncbi:putative arf-GAP with Rho-GAP domain, ANK repeat and PH domain-containing [Sesbania bispinosa]|nr:putative arf-GAP with Rho-GAP domain, ANK repeat and PH domain-containing [Sesbania bispinosa]